MSREQRIAVNKAHKNDKPRRSTFEKKLAIARAKRREFKQNSVETE